MKLLVTTSGAPISVSNTANGTPGTTAPTVATQVGGQYNTSLPTLTNGQLGALELDASGRLITAPQVNKAGSHTTGTVSTVATLTAPANAVAFILQTLDTNTTNVRWAIGATATTTVGMQLEPGRDTGLVPCGANVSVCSESGTNTYMIQWVLLS